MAEQESAWRAVLGELDHPRCARELSERTSLPRKTVESALARMAARRMVICVTPQVRQARLYEPTTFGRLMRLHHGHTNGIVQHSPEYLRLYAFVQAGRYRRLVVTYLDESMTPRQLRRQILTHYKRIGMGHVYRVAGDLQHQGLMSAVAPHYRLTDLGALIRSHMVIPTTNGADRRGLLRDSPTSIQ